MHTTDIGNSNIPAFLSKLWKIVEDPNTDNLIGWSESGNSFIIHNQILFSKELLPLYFKHSNTASFIRQLNMYGFRKLSNIEQGSLRFEGDEIEFYHQYFIKGRYSQLENIKRKMSTNKSSDSKVRPEILRDVLSEVNTIRADQENVDGLLKSMKEENTALWREVAILRQKHMKQQQIVEKLIQFLASIVKPNCKIGMKRKLPLMIGNGSNCMTADSKMPRLSQQHPKDNKRLEPSYPESSHFPMTSNSPNGPVIHDVTDSLEEEGPLTYVAASSVASPQESILKSKNISSSTFPTNSSLPSTELEPLVILSESPLSFQEVLSPQTESILPDSELLENKSLDTPAILLDPLTPNSLFPNTTFSESNEKDNETISEETTENKESELNNNQMQLAISTPSDSLTKNNFSDHLDTIETDLDWLHEQLSSGGLNIDTSALLGLFSSDDSLAGGIFPYETEKEDGNSVTGTELIQYTPSFDANLIDSTLFFSKPSNDDLPSLSEIEVTDLPTLSVDPLLCDQKIPPFTE